MNWKKYPLIVVACLITAAASGERVRATDLVADDYVSVWTGGVLSGNGDYAFGMFWAGSQATVIHEYVGPGDRYTVWTSFGDGNWNGPGTHQNHWGTADIDAYAVMQGDGNFVLYDSEENSVWSTSTASNPGARLSIQNDGNLVVYSSTDSVLWALW
jgi:hypothetical protein